MLSGFFRPHVGLPVGGATPRIIVAVPLGLACCLGLPRAAICSAVHCSLGTWNHQWVNQPQRVQLQLPRHFEPALFINPE
ncbi:hypothetical protein B0T11DRAFT_292149 [Plectosphaerella cucumerina]|uniref:Uncharacterized protein n=1 Tax=Plectosphaerella cucumerina TaxID=40658 RepID=A0A8K0T856_9PEZI|nr:hypothetical protein B0T11DRAFT_292149 [Plectosphaerella cucumerina]